MIRLTSHRVRQMSVRGEFLPEAVRLRAASALKLDYAVHGVDFIASMAATGPTA